MWWWWENDGFGETRFFREIYARRPLLSSTYCISRWVDAFWGFAVFSFTSTKRFISEDLKISVIHSRHRWHEHFTAEKRTNKMWKNIFCFNQIIDLKKAKKYTLQKLIIRMYASNRRRIAIFFCDQRIQFIGALKRCNNCFY